MAVTGVHTYGQPRLGNVAVRDFFQANYRGRFFRYVNDDDVVPRIPPGYEHVGRLIHFDSNGNVEQPATEAEARAIEPPPMTEEQFKRLQGEVRRLKAELRLQGRSDREAVLDASIEGLFPSISDHRLERYIAIIQRFASVRASLDAAVRIESSARVAMEAIESTTGQPARRRTTDDIPVLLRLRDANWNAPAGLQVGSRIGNLLSAQGSMDVLKILETDPDIDAIEVSREVGRPELANSVPFIGGEKLHRPPIAELGDSALVGLIDTGIDVLHEAFRDEQGKSRVLAIWNQLDDAGPSPNVVDPAAFQHTRGTLYLANDIEEFISGAKPTPPALRDPNEHGTHVASIAAGRRTGGLADGMAPDARIVVVIPKMRTAPADPWSVGYSTSHFEALAFLKRVAQGGNSVSTAALPMAVNVSLGMNAGAHDGSSLLEATFDTITTKGQDPGFVIVKSAGNERGFGGHARFQTFQGAFPIQWESDNKFRFQDYMELWYQSLDELEFTLIDPAGNSSATVSRSNRDVNQSLGGNACHLVLTERHKDNGDNRLVITIVPQSAAIQPGLWTLSVVGISVRSRSAQVDIWVERDDDARAVRFVPESPETTISIPGTADTVITVAACHAKSPLQLTTSSSFGLTRTGQPKPNISAPGMNIVAAKAATPNHSETRPMTGTSMAAPHVTGALALVFSHRHKQTGQAQYNARQLMAAVNQTARNATLHNPGVGYGMLDAEALFNLLK